MEISFLDVTVRRDGPTPKLVVTGQIHALETAISLPQLERLALYLADQVGRWRDDELSKAEAVQAQTEQPAPVSSVTTP